MDTPGPTLLLPLETMHSHFFILAYPPVYASLQPTFPPPRGLLSPSPVLGGNPLALGAPPPRLCCSWAPPTWAAMSQAGCQDCRRPRQKPSRRQGRQHPSHTRGHTLCHRKQTGWSNWAIPFPGLAQPQACRRNALFLQTKCSAQIKYTSVSVFTLHCCHYTPSPSSGKPLSCCSLPKSFPNASQPSSVLFTLV